jgi:hypothetical protein
LAAQPPSKSRRQSRVPEKCWHAANNTLNI